MNNPRQNLALLEKEFQDTVKEPWTKMAVIIIRIIQLSYAAYIPV